MKDVSTGEDFLLYSPGTADIVNEGRVHKPSVYPDRV